MIYKKDLQKNIEYLEKELIEVNKKINAICEDSSKEFKITKVVYEGWYQDEIIRKYELVKKTKKSKK